MKHWTGQAAGRVLLTGAAGLSAAGCCGNSRSRTAGVLRNTGWYYGNGFWRLRGLLGKLVGGAPRAPGSRPAGGGRHARLLAGRGLRKGSAPAALRRDEDPGRIWLQFEVNGDQAGTTLRQTAIFDPHGLAGRAYWYALTRFITSSSRGCCEGSNGLRSRAGEAHSTVRRRRRHSSPGARTIFRTAESPSVAKMMKLVMSKIGPAQLAVEDVPVSRVRLL